ncbi:MAG: YihY family inner membrane protein [Xanthomonadales bacterium]|jgi:membrane protein|nr:YihY family inner membrane protein [Xanthomonadales bacterium]
MKAMQKHPQKVRAVLTDVNQGKRLLLHVWRHFQEDRCFAEAASLSYTSLLSLVPLLAVVFGIASAFPVFEEWTVDLKEMVYRNLVPDTGTQLAANFEQFLESVNKLTLTGTFFLIITALMLMMRIEKSFNLIWRVPKPRPLVQKITMYWAVLTLGPLALGAATALSLQPLVDMVGGTAWIDSGTLQGLGVFLLTWAAFGLMFLLVPNCPVPISYAALGAFLSTALFTIAKIAFVGYVSRASYSVIYGALASVPIFLFWLYIVWAVILLGASLAAALTTFTDRGSDWEWPEAWELLLTYRMLGHLYQAQGEGKALELEALMELEPGVPSSRLQELLRTLMDENIITQDQDGGWLLKRNLEHYTLRELCSDGSFHLPIGKERAVPSESAWDGPFLELINAPTLVLDRPLASLYEAAEAKPESSKAPAPEPQQELAT